MPSDWLNTFHIICIQQQRKQGGGIGAYSAPSLPLPPKRLLNGLAKTQGGCVAKQLEHSTVMQLVLPFAMHQGLTNAIRGRYSMNTPRLLVPFPGMNKASNVIEQFALCPILPILVYSNTVLTFTSCHAEKINESCSIVEGVQ